MPFVVKYKKNIVRNEVTELCIKLHVRFRNGDIGISILTDDTAKFFSLDELYHDNGKSCKKYIKQCANADLQTYFK